MGNPAQWIHLQSYNSSCMYCRLCFRSSTCSSQTNPKTSSKLHERPMRSCFRYQKRQRPTRKWTTLSPRNYSSSFELLSKVSHYRIQAPACGRYSTASARNIWHGLRHPIKVAQAYIPRLAKTAWIAFVQQANASFPCYVTMQKMVLMRAG